MSQGRQTGPTLAHLFQGIGRTPRAHPVLSGLGWGNTVAAWQGCRGERSRTRGQSQRGEVQLFPPAGPQKSTSTQGSSGLPGPTHDPQDHMGHRAHQQLKSRPQKHEASAQGDQEGQPTADRVWTHWHARGRCTFCRKQGGWCHPPPGKGWKG